MRGREKATKREKREKRETRGKREEREKREERGKREEREEREKKCTGRTRPLSARCLVVVDEESLSSARASGSRSMPSAKVPPGGKMAELRSRGLNPFSGNVPPGGKMAECFLIRIGHCTFTSRSHTSLRVSRKGYKKREERREERGKRERRERREKRERRNVLVGRDRFQRGASWWSMRNLLSAIFPPGGTNAEKASRPLDRPSTFFPPGGTLTEGMERSPPACAEDSRPVGAETRRRCGRCCLRLISHFKHAIESLTTLPQRPMQHSTPRDQPAARDPANHQAVAAWTRRTSRRRCVRRAASRRRGGDSVSPLSLSHARIPPDPPISKLAPRDLEFEDPTVVFKIERAKCQVGVPCQASMTKNSFRHGFEISTRW